MTLAARIGACAIGFVLVFGTCLSAVKTVVVPRAIASPITRYWFASWRRVFHILAREPPIYRS